MTKECSGDISRNKVDLQEWHHSQKQKTLSFKAPEKSLPFWWGWKPWNIGASDVCLVISREQRVGAFVYSWR